VSRLRMSAVILSLPWYASVGSTETTFTFTFQAQTLRRLCSTIRHWRHTLPSTGILSLRVLSHVNPINTLMLWEFREHTDERSGSKNPQNVSTLINYTQQSPFAGATRLSACQEIRILWKPKVNHRVYRSLSPVPSLSQMKPVHILPSRFFMMHLSVTLPTMTSSSKWSVSLRSPHQARHAPLLSLYVLHAPPISSSLIWLPSRYLVMSRIYISWGLHYTVFSIFPFLPPSLAHTSSSAPFFRKPLI